jgi:class 3 adenylate cyclase/tetratricopeptide (TPR) repeat protein
MPGDSVRAEGSELERTGARRSYVTLLFSDLCDYTVLNELIDPEEANELRQSMEQLCQRVIVAHGGHINQFVGDGTLAVFGFPQADETAVEHAVEAALELHAEAQLLNWPPAQRLGFQIRLHSGIHSGIVLVREGDPRHGRYELTGDAVNTAARLCTAAGRDEILVSEEALRGAEALFEVHRVTPLSLKGKKQLMPAFRVDARASAETRFDARSRHGLTPFVGRLDELAVLEAGFARARSGHGSVRCVVGDAGIGKTRLLEELRSRAHGFGARTVRGSCESYGGSAPLRPFLQIVRQLLSLTEQTPPEAAATRVEEALSAIDGALSARAPVFLRLLSLRPWPESANSEKLQTAIAAALIELLLAQAKAQPLFIVLDDWQWADTSSILVLGRLLPLIRDRAVMIVVGARDVSSDDPVLGPVPALRLLPFTEQEATDVVRALVGQPLSAGLVAKVHRRSGGNPLFVEEICQSLSSLTEEDDELDRRALPGSVHGLILARLEKLAPDCAKLLRTASVIGNEFELWLLESLHESPTLWSSLQKLLDEGLIHVTDSRSRFAFKHGITREVVYESVLVRERRELHGRLAAAIEARFSNAALVDHYEALASHYAGSAAWERAADFAELSGDKAAKSSALDRARTHYAAALSHIDRLTSGRDLRGRWLAIVAKWCLACVFSPTRDQLQVLERARRYAEELEDFAALSNVDYWMGWIHYALGQQDTAIRHSTRALSLAERAHNEPLRAQLLVNLGQSYAAAGAYALAIEHLDLGIAAKRARGSRARSSGVPVGFAYALGCRALVYGDQGQFSRAYREIDEALEGVKGTGHAIEGSLLCLLGMIQLWQGEWHAALETAARGRATGERINGPYVLAICQTVASTARWVLDRRRDVIQDLVRAVSWLERRDIRLYLSFAQSQLAQIQLEAGNVEAAESYARSALDRAQNGDPIGEVSACRVLSTLHFRADRPDEARTELQRALDLASARPSERDLAVTRLLEAQMLWSKGDQESARELLERVKRSFEELEMRWYRAEAARLLETV